MKRILAAILTAAVLLCGFAALAETTEAGSGDKVNTLIDSGSFIVQIDVSDGDMGWYADDMSQDNSVVTLYDADIIEGTFVARYDPVADGEITVAVQHFYTGFACDEAYTWDLLVKDGAVQECTGGSYTAISDDAEIDPYLSGEWLEKDTQFAALSVEKNPSRGWDVEIVSPLTHGAYVFKTSVYQDCVSGNLLYDKGKFWEVPITDSEDVELGEATLAGTTGCFSIDGEGEDAVLTWHDDVSQADDIVFTRADPAQ